MKVYISGPMRGVPLYNFPAFDRMAEELRDEGHVPVNPAAMDRDDGFDPGRDLPDDWDWSDLPDKFYLQDAIDRDIAAIRDCDAIIMLKGWENSQGATAEKHLAEWMDLIVCYEEQPDTAEKRKQRPVASGVLDYFPDAIMAIANCSWVGNEQHNPGEPLHWSRHKSNDHADCMMRHFMERGQVDSDGIRHSTKAAWRALALLQLEIEAERD